MGCGEFSTGWCTKNSFKKGEVRKEKDVVEEVTWTDTQSIISKFTSWDS